MVEALLSGLIGVLPSGDGPGGEGCWRRVLSNPSGLSKCQGRRADDSINGRNSSVRLRSSPENPTVR